jgi:hypothetical protein
VKKEPEGRWEGRDKENKNTADPSPSGAEAKSAAADEESVYVRLVRRPLHNNLFRASHQ